MPNPPTEYTVQYLKNLSADLTGTTPIPREGLLGKAANGNWYNVSVDAMGNLGTSAKTMIDKASASVTYVGQAGQGTATSAASWRIKRITVDGTVTAIEFADGDDLLNNVWDDRATLEYS